MNVLVHHEASPGFREAVAAAAPPEARCTYVAETDRAGFAAALADAEVLLHVLEPLAAADFARAPRLRLVQKIGVGVNTIDLVACRELGIGVANMPGTNTQAVAEMTLALLFAALRRIPSLDAATRAGRGFPLDDATLDALVEVAGRKVALVGFGAVSARLAPMLEAIGAEVLVVARRPVEGRTVLALDDALAAADVVSLHLPLTPETKGLLSRERLFAMRRGAVLVNTSRGGLVDQPALVEALTRGPLAAAGLDVFADEPIATGEPLLTLPNVALAPHVAWRTRETLARSFAVAFENARRALAGVPLVHEVVPVGRRPDTRA